MFVVYARRARHSTHDSRTKAFHTAHRLRTGGVTAFVIMARS